MKRRYDSELLELPGTYGSVLNSNLAEELKRVVRVQRPMVFVGSGGALSVARLAADLHMWATGEIGLAATPLEAATWHLSPRTGLVLFSSRAQHPDAALTIRAARARGATHIGVLTSRSREQLPASLRAGDVHVATVPAPRDGFLATNSLLAMATALCLAHGIELPPSLPAFVADGLGPIRRSCVALTGPGTAAVGIDVEVRLVETGLASVQLTDYRNLAHGRHVGLARHLPDLTVLAVMDTASEGLAESTLALLPSTVDLVRLRSELPWPVSVLDLLVLSMYMTSAVGHEREIDPGRPSVQQFGRRLYHLPVGKWLAAPAEDPVSRKLATRHPDMSLRQVVDSAFLEWLEAIRLQAFGGVVLDYDGTCLPTWDRSRPPPRDVQREIVRLLDRGLVVGFATGRGRSLYEVTRTWLPRVFWPRVHVGLYNGTVLLRLSDSLPNSSKCIGPLAEAADRLDNLGFGLGLKVDRRNTQISVGADGSSALGPRLLPFVRSVLSRPPALPCKVLASGHSVDVVALSASKTAVLKSVTDDCAGAVLAIGDQGQVDGNDFELLAATHFSLTVNMCSLDPTRCWNLDKRGVRGPELLATYLRALRPSKAGHRFRWPPP
jgi:hypothetical protein